MSQWKKFKRELLNWRETKEQYNKTYGMQLKKYLEGNLYLQMSIIEEKI